MEQPISTDGWKYLFAQVDPHRNFDGELMAFGSMSGHDMDRIINDLILFGYVGPDQGDKSDMVLSSSFSGGDLPPIRSPAFWRPQGDEATSVSVNQP